MNIGLIGGFIIAIPLCFILPAFYRLLYKLDKKYWWDKFDD